MKNASFLAAITTIVLIGLICMVLLLGAVDEETALAQTEIEAVLLQAEETILQPTFAPEDPEALGRLTEEEKSGNES